MDTPANIVATITGNLLVIFVQCLHAGVFARFFHSSSAALLLWRSAFSQFVPVAKFKLPFLASGSNISVKPTRILRSAYLARYPAFALS